MRHCRVVVVLACVACLVSGLGWAQAPSSQAPKSQAPKNQAPDEKEIKAYIDLMRKDLQNEKNAVVDRAMALDAAKKAEFWAVYAGYQKELDAIWDQRIVNVKKYADNFTEMTDAVADQLATKMMELEGQRAALRNKYYGIYKQKMGSRLAARFLQVEVSLACLIDLQLASEIPIIQ